MYLEYKFILSCVILSNQNSFNMYMLRQNIHEVGYHMYATDLGLSIIWYTKRLYYNYYICFLR